MADLAFAISSNAAGKEQTFKKIKDSLDFIMTYYGAERIRYAVITFGLSSYEDITFQDGRTVDELRERLERIPRASGVPDLKESLEKAKDVFDKATDRPEAKKFLIVVMDSKSSSIAVEVQQGAEALEKEDIKVSYHPMHTEQVSINYNLFFCFGHGHYAGTLKGPTFKVRIQRYRILVDNVRESKQLANKG